jgi:predicted transposase/invertase (TIGR01784 family)
LATLTVKEDVPIYSRTSLQKIESPHDKFFKETFGHVEVAQSFLHNYLPKHVMEALSIGTLEPEKDSFIDRKLEEGFSDLLFSADINGRMGYVYFLFEHKSYPDKTIAFQLLKYMGEIWNTKMKKEKMDQVPLIIPLVIYHGASRWNIEKTLGEMIVGYSNFSADIRKFAPDYGYLIYDISKYTDDEIMGEARVRILFTAFRDVRKAKNIQELLVIIDKAIIFLQDLHDKQTGIEYFETFMRYIFSAAKNLTRKDADEIVKKVEENYPEGSGLVMTLADIWREEGIRKGEAQGIKKVALEMLRKGFPVELVAEVTHMDVKEIRKMKEQQ